MSNIILPGETGPAKYLVPADGILEYKGVCKRCGKKFEFSMNLPTDWLTEPTYEQKAEMEEVLAIFGEVKTKGWCPYCVKENTLERFWKKHEGLRMR